jgi:cell division protein FtsN
VATAALFLYEPGAVRQVADGSGTVTDRADKPPRTRFEFYTLLPEKEMLIPELDIEESAPPAPVASSDVPVARASAPASEARGKYLLQVGSFRSLEDADRLKAKLAFLGLEGSIQTISINGRETWHRVRVGPYSARAQLDEAHAMLKANKYDVLLLKLKEQ